MLKQTLTLMLSITIVFLGLFAISSYEVWAQCASEDQCYNGSVCTCVDYNINDRTCEQWTTVGSCGAGEGQEVIGNVTPPEAIYRWRNLNDMIGIINFLSTLIRIITVVAGIFAMFNFIAAGLIYITSMGNTNANIEVRDKLIFSVIGLLIIVGAYSLAGLIGLIFFGDAGFILNPTITGAIDLVR